MLTIIVRVFVIYILVLFIFRFMGKRQLGQMQPFELVLTLIVADIATIPMADISIPLIHGVVPLLTLVVAHFLLTTISRLSEKFSKFVNGRPVIVINPNGIDYKTLQALNITIDDLFEAIRVQGYFSFEQINYAIMETTGKVTVIPKAEFAPATCGDLGLKVEESTIPITLISQGSYILENAKRANIDREFIDTLLKKERINKIKDVLILTISNNGTMYFQKKNCDSKILQKEDIAV